MCKENITIIVWMDKSGKHELKKLKKKSNIKKPVTIVKGTPHKEPTKTKSIVDPIAEKIDKNLGVSQSDWKTSVYSQAQNLWQRDKSTIPHLSQHIAQTNFNNSYKTLPKKTQRSNTIIFDKDVSPQVNKPVKHHPSPVAQILAKEIEGYSLKEIDSEVNALLQGKYTDSLTIPEFKERIMQNLKLNNNDSIYYSDSDSDC